MPDVFGGSGQGTNQGGESSGGGDDGSEHEFFEYDNESGEMIIKLPPRFAKYKKELYEDLYHEYFLDSPGNETSADISRFIAEWLRDRTGEEV